MKLLLILGDDETCKTLTRCVEPLGFEFVRYNHVLKAMDNLDEVAPHGIIISARDFPRHWKILANFVRGEQPKETCPLIILKGDDFPAEDASKASFLGVSGIINEALNDPAEISRLQEILGRYIPVKEKRRTGRFCVEPQHRFGFVFIRPGANRTLITGAVKNISAGGLSFQPDDVSLLTSFPEDITSSTVLSECSLRAGDAILSPLCRVNRIGQSIALAFSSFPDGEQEVLNSYLESLSG